MSDMMTQKDAINMSNEQAVQILIPMRTMMCDQYGCPISDAVLALDKAIEALSADRPSAVDLSSVYSTAYKSGYEKGKADRPQGWIPCSERLPETDGLYLAAYSVYSNVAYKTLFFTHDLYKVDDYDFADKKGKSGWYSYDDEYGYFELDVEAWMPIEQWKGSDVETSD